MAETDVELVERMHSLSPDWPILFRPGNGMEEWLRMRELARRGAAAGELLEALKNIRDNSLELFATGEARAAIAQFEGQTAATQESMGGEKP